LKKCKRWRFIDVKYYKKVPIKMVTEELNKAYGSLLRHQYEGLTLQISLSHLIKRGYKKVSKRY